MAKRIAGQQINFVSLCQLCTSCILLTQIPINISLFHLKISITTLCISLTIIIIVSKKCAVESPKISFIFLLKSLVSSH